ncbi:MAG: hypothetical protein QOC65_1486 [Sphingomonadales bacterium]|nr:hypothetical protein [Sphingomonadales bacterium]
MAGKKKGKNSAAGAADPPPSMRRLGSSPGRALSGAASHKGGGGKDGSPSGDPNGSLSQAERELRASGKRPRLIRNKRREIQVAPTSRKLFEGEIKATFLEWFAATANLSLSARKAGIHYRTVLRHRAEDPVFAADMERALESGILRTKAWLLELGEEAGTEIDWEKVDMKPVNLTPEMALQLIREHERRQAGPSTGSGRAGYFARPGRAPTVATSAEVQAALVKALRAYGDRLRAEEKKDGDSHE